MSTNPPDGDPSADVVSPSRAAGTSEIDIESAVETPVPDAVAGAFSRTFRLPDRPADLGDLVEALETVADRIDEPTDLDLLCSTNDGRDATHLDDEVHTFACTLDALILPLALSEPAIVRSESPTDGTVIEIEVLEDRVTVDPPGAILILGFPTADSAVDSVDSADEAIGAVCPLVSVFPSEDAGKRWLDSREDVAAMSVDVGTAAGLAAALAELLD